MKRENEDGFGFNTSLIQPKFGESEYSGNYSKDHLEQSLRKMETSMKMKASPKRMNAPAKIVFPPIKKLKTQI